MAIGNTNVTASAKTSVISSTNNEWTIKYKWVSEKLVWIHLEKTYSSSISSQKGTAICTIPVIPSFEQKIIAAQKVSTAYVGGGEIVFRSDGKAYLSCPEYGAAVSITCQGFLVVR